MIDRVEHPRGVEELVGSLDRRSALVMLLGLGAGALTACSSESASPARPYTIMYDQYGDTPGAKPTRVFPGVLTSKESDLVVALRPVMSMRNDGRLGGLGWLEDGVIRQVPFDPRDPVYKFLADTQRLAVNPLGQTKYDARDI